MIRIVACNLVQDQVVVYASDICAGADCDVFLAAQHLVFLNKTVEASTFVVFFQSFEDVSDFAPCRSYAFDFVGDNDFIDKVRLPIALYRFPRQRENELVDLFVDFCSIDCRLVDLWSHDEKRRAPGYVETDFMRLVGIEPGLVFGSVRLGITVEDFS